MRILREHYSDNDVDLQVPVLVLMTDGGPDHRVTYETVKLSLVELFIQLDLDILIALRTAPCHSWVNPAERCMSLLNLALQHSALERQAMPENWEKRIKHASSLGAIRNAASLHPELLEAFSECMVPVVDSVNQRFERMKLKGEPIRTYKGVTTEEIDRGLEAVNLVLPPGPTTFSHITSTRDLKKCQTIQDFIKIHSKSTHYSFQLRKCSGEGCVHCTLHPCRLKRDLHFLPDPVPNGEHYKKFEEVYGTQTTDGHRPSAQSNDMFDDDSREADKTNVEVLKAGKVRSAIPCGECEKPRCIYSQLKLSRDQEAELQRIKEAHWFICGDGLDSDAVITRRCLTCTSPMESQYFSSSNCGLPTVCYHCGSEESLLDDYEDYMEDLYSKFSSVRPICAPCRAKGLEAKTWGQKFFKKKKILP